MEYVTCSEQVEYAKFREVHLKLKWKKYVFVKWSVFIQIHVPVCIISYFPSEIFFEAHNTYVLEYVTCSEQVGY